MNIQRPKKSKRRFDQSYSGVLFRKYPTCLTIPSSKWPYKLTRSNRFHKCLKCIITGNYHKDGLDLSRLHTFTNSSQTESECSWSVCIISSSQTAIIMEEIMVIKFVLYTNWQFSIGLGLIQSLHIKTSTNVGGKINFRNEHEATYWGKWGERAECMIRLAISVACASYLNALSLKCRQHDNKMQQSAADATYYYSWGLKF